MSRFLDGFPADAVFSPASMMPTVMSPCNMSCTRAGGRGQQRCASALRNGLACMGPCACVGRPPAPLLLEPPSPALAGRTTRGLCSPDTLAKHSSFARFFVLDRLPSQRAMMPQEERALLRTARMERGCSSCCRQGCLAAPWGGQPGTGSVVRQSPAVPPGSSVPDTPHTPPATQSSCTA